MSGLTGSQLLRYFCVEMFKKLYKLEYWGLIALVLMAGCSTDFEVNAPFRETPIVYCILNPDSAIHVVRINRGFQNRDGRDARDIAKQNPDSSNLKSGVYEVFMLRENWVPNRYFTERVNFKDTIIKDKSSDGDFTNADYLSFKTVRRVNFQYDAVLSLGQQRWRNQTVRLFVVNKSTGDTIKASTRIIGDFRSLYPEDVPPRIPFYFNPKPAFQRFGPRLQFTVPCWANSYKANLDFTLREIYTSGDSADYTLNWENATTFDVSFPSCGTLEDRSGDANTATFFNLLKQIIRSRNNEGLVRSRKMVGGRVYYYAATENLTRYITVANNFNPITQSVPVYSNIEGGLGIFGSVRLVSLPFEIRQEMIDEMNEIQGRDTLYRDLIKLKFVRLR